MESEEQKDIFSDEKLELRHLHQQISSTPYSFHRNRQYGMKNKNERPKPIKPKTPLSSSKQISWLFDEAIDGKSAELILTLNSEFGNFLLRKRYPAVRECTLVISMKSKNSQFKHYLVKEAIINGKTQYMIQLAEQKHKPLYTLQDIVNYVEEGFLGNAKALTEVRNLPPGLPKHVHDKLSFRNSVPKFNKTDHLSRTLDQKQHLQSGLRNSEFPLVFEDPSSFSPITNSGHFPPFRPVDTKTSQDNTPHSSPSHRFPVPGRSKNYGRIPPHSFSSPFPMRTRFKEIPKCITSDAKFIKDLKNLEKLDENEQAKVKIELSAVINSRVKNIAREEEGKIFKSNEKQAFNDLKNYLLKEASKQKKIPQPSYIDDVISNIDVELSDCWPNTAYNEGTSYPVGNTSIKQLFDDHKTSHETSKHSFIAIVGSSGSGKTAIVKNLLKEYSEKKQLQGTDYVFHIDFSAVNLKKETNLLQTLARNLPAHWVLYDAGAEVILKDIDEKRNLWVIIDGFELGDLSCHDRFLTILTEETISTIEIHLMNILSHKSLPGANILLTLSPSQVLKLPSTLNPNPIAIILGINENSQKNLSRIVSKTKSNEILSFIQSYPALNSFCFVPEFCLSVMYTIDELLTQNECSNPLTSFPLTQIFASVLVLIVWEKNLKNSTCSYLCLAKFAWQRFSETSSGSNLATNTTQHLCEIIDIFLQLTPSKNLSSKFSVDLYRICQDFGVALQIMHLAQDNGKVLQEYLSKWLKKQFFGGKDQHCEITTFLFGLCNMSIEETLKELLPNLSVIDSTSKMLVDNVFMALESFDKQQKEAFSTLLFISCLAFEMQKKEFNTKLANVYFPDEIHVDSDCSSGEIAAFLYVLEFREKNLTVFNTALLTRLTNNLILDAKRKPLKNFITFP